MKLLAVLNEYASLFKDIADQDYISARSNYRLRLREQFFWAGLQALEKYLKGILLFNQRSIVQYRNHDLSAVCKAVETIPWIDLCWPATLEKTLKRFRELGDNRYLSTDTYVRPHNLGELDEAVWHIRRYCQYVRVTVTAETGTVDLTQQLVKAINAMDCKRPRRFKLSLSGGYLEKVLASSQSDAARRALVWNNRFFGSSRVSTATKRVWSSSQVPPNRRTWFTATVKKEVEKYIYFPR